MKILVLAFAMLFCMSTTLLADDDTTQTTTPSMGRGRHGGNHTNSANANDNQTTKNQISGQCSVIADDGNIAASPCVSITLKLDAGNGKDILTTRTSSTGSFEFSAPADVKYTISATSRFYEVVSPKGPISGARKINLQLKQK